MGDALFDTMFDVMADDNFGEIGFHGINEVIDTLTEITGKELRALDLLKEDVDLDDVKKVMNSSSFWGVGIPSPLQTSPQFLDFWYSSPAGRQNFSVWQNIFRFLGPGNLF